MGSCVLSQQQVANAGGVSDATAVPQQRAAIVTVCRGGEAYLSSNNLWGLSLPSTEFEPMAPIPLSGVGQHGDQAMGGAARGSAHPLLRAVWPGVLVAAGGASENPLPQPRVERPGCGLIFRKIGDVL